jgi:hypothetical protein
MVRPDDCARRITGEAARPAAGTSGVVSVRYGLFGHDLEKGVVLRARLRGLWLDLASEDEVRRHHDAFLREPPALGP